MDKSFDCVEMKREGQRIVRDRLNGMSRDQQVAYWKSKRDEMLAKAAASQTKRSPA
jgi:DNA polymerase III psi subunit